MSPAPVQYAPITWLLSDGAAGNARQTQALARALGLTAREFGVRAPPPWSWLAPRVLPGISWAAGPQLRQALAREQPGLVIGCGRAAAQITAWLRQHTRAFAVQILDPRVKREAWDLIITPRHDDMAGPNVLTTLGAINDITPARLREAGAAWSRFEQYPTPRTAVLIGGSTGVARIDTFWCDYLLERLSAWQSREPGAFLVTASRRTAPKIVARLRAAFARWPGFFWAPGDGGDNPYPGLLAHAQRVVVSPDSVNLISEACATALPVFVPAPRAIVGKLARFHAELMARDRIRALGAEPERWTPQPLDEMPALAATVWERYRQNRG